MLPLFGGYPGKRKDSPPNRNAVASPEISPMAYATTALRLKIILFSKPRVAEAATLGFTDVAPLGQMLTSLA